MIITEGKTVIEVANEILAKLIQQGRRCMNGDGACLYGDMEGNHCAVGWLLPPEGTEEMFFLKENVYGLADTMDDLGANDNFIRENLNFLNTMQQFHDEGDCENYLRDLEGIDQDLIDQWKKIVLL